MLGFKKFIDENILPIPSVEKLYKNSKTLKLNDEGFGKLSDLITLHKRANGTPEQLRAKVKHTFGLGDDKTLNKFMKKHINESLDPKYKEFGIDAFETKKQMNAISRLDDFRIYVNADPLKKIYVRKDHNGHFMIANQDQKYVLGVSVWKTGKVFGHCVYKKDGNVLSIVKTVGEW